MRRDKTIATLCSGGECVGVGASAAGYRHLWGIEHRPDVAQVAEMNGFRSIIADIRNVDPGTLDAPYALHASPPCLDASGANGKRIESDTGRELGRAVARFIEALQPTVFTLENIWFYRYYDSFQCIVDTLFRLGYMVNWQHLNSADFGVPQTRKRLILRAVQGALLPMLPEPEPWIGWYEAIEDLIPTLPDSQFAPWQLERLPESIGSLLVDSAGYPQGDGRVPVCREQAEPANTIIANHARRPMRAFLVHPTDMRSMPTRDAEDPAFTVMAGSYDKSHAPAWKPRAFLVSNAKTERSDGTRTADEPSLSVTTQSGGRLRAFLADSQNSNREEVTTRQHDEPAFTMTNPSKGYPRAWLKGGRVVQLSVRALARLQSIPDSYRLPAKKTLACYVVGNAVPPLMYQKIIAQFGEC